METLQINKENALKAYEEANDKGKIMLANLFGKKIFFKSVTERIQSFEDACEEQGLDPVKRLRYPANTINAEEISENGYIKLITCFKSLNEGIKLSVHDQSRYRYYPYFISSGVGLSFNDFGIVDSGTVVGVPLTLATKELAIFVGKHPQFIQYYNEYNNA